jgi:hypothetical protein
LASGYAYGDGYGGGIYNSGTLTVTSSTLSHNSALASGYAYGDGYGGGIYNSGTLTVTSSTLSANAAGGGGKGADDGGGGIYNSGTLTVTSSTLSANAASATASGQTGGHATASGGGISNSGLLTVSNSTLSANSVTASAQATMGVATASGGGIYNSNTLTVTSSTLSANAISASGQTQTSFGGGIDNSNALDLRNTLVALNTAATSPDLSGSVSSLGHNLIGDGTGGSGYDPTDLVGTSSNPIDPRLGPLQGNGGPTQTMALLAGSPAIDAGDNTDAPATDQRGFARIVGGTIDIGAFEVQPAGQANHLALQAPASTSAGTPFAITVAVLDDFGQPTAGYLGTVHFAASNGAQRDYTFTTADQGQHTFGNLVLRRAQTLTVTGTDSANPALNGNVTFTITPAAADHLAFTVSAPVTAGVPFAITVTVQDVYGNTVTDYTGTVHFAAYHGGDLIASRDYTFTAGDSGQHTFAGLVLNQPADYTVTGEDPLTGIGGSVTFSVDPA